MSRKHTTPEGSQIAESKVQRYAKALDRIEKKHNGITPGKVVDDARDPKSDLHDYFDWDDTRAADLYRRRQARKLIQWITVEVTLIGPKKPRDITAEVQIVRKFHSVCNERGERKYVTVEKVKENEVYRRQLHRECVDDSKRFADKADTFRDLNGKTGADYRAQLREECLELGRQFAAKAKMFPDLKDLAAVVEARVAKARRKTG